MIDRVNQLIITFVDRHTLAGFETLMGFLVGEDSEKLENSYFQMITWLVCKEFDITLEQLKGDGNDMAIRRNICYYFHKKYDKAFNIMRMVRSYGKQANSVRNGLVKVQNIIDSPRVSRELHEKIINIESKLNALLVWRNQTGTEPKMEW